MTSKENYLDVLISFLQDVEETRMEYVDKNKELLNSLLSKDGSTSDLLKKLWDKSCDSDMSVSQKIEIYKLYASLRSKGLLTFIDRRVQSEEDGFDILEKFPDILSAFFVMGMWSGLLSCVETCEIDHDHCVVDYFHSIKSRDIIEKRWENTKKNKEDILAPALSYAESKWSNDNSPLQHNDMADLLLKNFPELLKNKVSKFLVLSKLKPIAQKYGRVRGAKKNG